MPRHLMAVVVVLLCWDLSFGQQTVSTDAQFRRQRAEALLGDIQEHADAVPALHVKLFRKEVLAVSRSSIQDTSNPSPN